jgi:ribosomal protein L16 Arg81 hydroxylase
MCCLLFVLQAVLDRYQALLSEYRLHKQALGDWFGGVLRQQRRQPQLLDAQATGDEALVAR